MKKKILMKVSILLLVMEIINLSLYDVNAAQEEDKSEYVVYDCMTGETHDIESYCVAENNVETQVNVPSWRYSPVFDMISETSESASTYKLLSPEIGDQREKVDATVSPYNKILCLALYRDTNNNGIFDERPALGTGFMISENLMLTAGHCVYNSSGYIGKMEIYVKQGADVLNSRYYLPAEYVLSSEFMSAPDSDSENDWCIVRLQNNVGSVTGYFSCESTNYSKNVTVSGYPDDEAHYYYQYADSGRMDVMSYYMVAHTCDTEGGQSGAPIFDSNNVVYGIHTEYGDTCNYGVRITPELLSLIESMK